IYNQKVNVFTFLRHPVSRLISEYIFYKTWKNNHLYKIINENQISFSEYLLSKDRLLIYRGKNFMTRCISGKGFIATKHPYSALAVAKKNLEKKFFFFGIQEKFTESVILLSKILNFTDIFFQVHNKLSINLKSYITDKDKEIALELNRADCELYNFAVKCFEDKISKCGQSFSSEVNKFSILNNNYQNKFNQSIPNKNSVDIILPKN
ncbi:MAG: sulfotransferase family protein, partial [Desulfovibrio sp.]|nr:sulfotransferase family protein [Desulfovibrio sp.]